MKCPVCGKDNPENASSCTRCGAAFSQIEPSSPEKPRTKGGFWASIHSLLFRPLWPQKQAPPKKPTSRLAIASLILALMGIPLSPVPTLISGVVAVIMRVPSIDALPFSPYIPAVPLSLAAFVLGIVALVKIHRRHGRIAGSRHAAAAVVLSAALLGWGYFLSPHGGELWAPQESVAKNLPRFLTRRPMGMYQAAANRVTCRMNLSDIGLALHAYATDHGGRFPAGRTAVEAFKELVESKAFERLVAEGNVPGPEIFVCPAVWRDMNAWLKTKKLSEKTCSYNYVPGLSEESPVDLIVAYDKSVENHWYAGRNVVFIDGHVEWLREETFQQLLAEQLQKTKSAE